MSAVLHARVQRLDSEGHHGGTSYIPFIASLISLDLTTDPAIERWAEFRNQQHRTFRFTPRNTFWAVLMCIALPYGVIKMAYYTRVFFLPTVLITGWVYQFEWQTAWRISVSRRSVENGEERVTDCW